MVPKFVSQMFVKERVDGRVAKLNPQLYALAHESSKSHYTKCTN
jgi:hypothetical protein